MRRKAAEKLRQFYSRFNGDSRVLVVISADPDAIASAMAVKRLLWRKVAAVTIASVNTVKRPDNLAMLRLLDVHLIHMDQVDTAAFNRFVVVDSQPNHHPIMETLAFDVIIDHHPDTQPKAAVVDLRPKYGATASILVEYLRAARIKPSVKLATGLFFAIKIDTNDFARPTVPEDLGAFHFVFRRANPHLVRRIAQTDLKPEFLKYFQRALQTRRLRKGRLFAHLGPVSTPDCCVLVADFFMRVETVNWSVVSGVHDKKLIVVMRNDGLRKDAGKLAKASFGDIGSAGGHRGMARAEILLEKIRAIAERGDDKLAQWVAQQTGLAPKRRGDSKPKADAVPSA